MTVDISNHEGTIIWDNIYYFSLSDYPNITDWELRKLILFREYEKNHGRETKVVCDNKVTAKAVDYALANPAIFLSAQMPEIITENKICKQKGCMGCMTDFMCHTTSIESAKSIISCGKLLSAVNASKKKAVALAKEARNAANDPIDYFDYIMFAWGNCQAGDRLVMERLLGNKAPTEYDLSAGLKPGVRFYFKYETIVSHKDYTYDGYHPAKIKNQLILSENLHCCIIPQQHKTEFANIIPSVMADKVFYIKNDCNDVWNWSLKVYNFVKAINI